MPDHPHPLLRISNLSISFGNIPAIRSLNLEVNRGEIVALVGESGSGKSITALSVLGLLSTPPAFYEDGNILFSADGNSVLDLLENNHVLTVRGNRIGMVFQEPMSALNPVMTCGRQVAEVLRRHLGRSVKQARAEAIWWLERVRIPDAVQAYDKYPHQMSGGQKQRVMIALAMCCRPQLLVCDEPTTALDVRVQQHILELIADLQSETGMGVLFITHDLGVVRRIAHRAVVVHQGVVVEAGPTNRIFTQPAHAYTRALLACRPASQPKGMRLPVVADFMEGAPVPAPVPLPKVPISDTLVSVQHLVVSFPTRRNFWGRPTAFFNAVDGVSFIIKQGETVGLVGESGCGKTTLGRTLLRLVAPSGGSVEVAGKDLSGLNPQEWRSMRKEVQLVFQDPFAALNPRLTVADALEEPLILQGMKPKERRKKMQELLSLVQLPQNAAGRYPHQFSGGQRQRIVIARALAPGPVFLVCDESVSALDVSVQAQVLNLLNDLKAELGLTLLFISHDLAVVRYMSDRILVMHQGQIVEQGDAEQIFRTPGHPYTQALLAATPL